MDVYKQILDTPEPHYIPGYTGYARTIPFHFGKTYGRITHDILKNPKTARADHTLLSPTTGAPDYYPEYSDYCPPDVSDQIHPQKLVPGYTGYIPQKLFNYGGNYYKETLQSGLDLRRRQMEYAQKLKEPVLITYVNGRRKLAVLGENRPLKPLAANVDPVVWTHLYKHKHEFSTQPPELQRRNISGYMGFIPRMGYEFGHTYKDQVKTAMDKFQRKQVAVDHTLLLSLEKQLSIKVSSPNECKAIWYQTDCRIHEKDEPSLKSTPEFWSGFMPLAFNSPKYLVRNKLKGCPEELPQPENKLYLTTPMVPKYGGHVPGHHLIEDLAELIKCRNPHREQRQESLWKTPSFLQYSEK